MISRNPALPKGDTIVIFGPQALSFNATDFERLRSAARVRPEWTWILETISELPESWETFATQLPKYNNIAGQQQLKDLRQWFITGVMPGDQRPLSNLLLSPLVVVSHVVEYLGHRDSETPLASASPTADQHTLRKVKGTLGFCTGILSAIAVSLSKNGNDLRKYAANAVRLAMLVGGIVDSQGQRSPEGEWKALATAWNTSRAGDQVQNVLEKFPQVSNVHRTNLYGLLKYVTDIKATSRHTFLLNMMTIGLP